MTESCPGDKFKSGLVTPSACETIKEEVIREKIVHLLLNEKGYQDADLVLEVPYALVMGSETFQVQASILIQLEGKKVVLIKCGAGSIMARERAALALARLITDYQIPLTIVTNSEDATLLNTINGETLECGMPAILNKAGLVDRLPDLSYLPLTRENAGRWRTRSSRPLRPWACTGSATNRHCFPMYPSLSRISASTSLRFLIIPAHRRSLSGSEKGFPARIPPSYGKPTPKSTHFIPLGPSRIPSWTKAAIISRERP